MRGERLSSDWTSAAPFGSSPHARGTPRADDEVRRRRRIIPACAGNAPLARSGHMPYSDHPRMRGERFDAAVALNSATGSSPHARGTPQHAPDLARAGRIIPACAGNAPCPASPLRYQPDHPRMRGERVSSERPCAAWIGSSPHARGTHRDAPGLGLARRIIPACAGNAATPRAAP